MKSLPPFLLTTWTTTVLLLVLIFSLEFSHALLTAEESQSMLNRARTLLNSGGDSQTQEAIRLMEMSTQELPDSDPDHYLVRFKRAILWLSVGRQHSALEDFSWVLDKRPGFDQALVQRAKVYARLCRLDEAAKDLEKLGSSSPSSSSNEVQELQQQVTNAQSIMRKLEKNSFYQSLTSCSPSDDRKSSLNENEYRELVDSATAVLQVCSHDPQIRCARAQLYESGFKSSDSSKQRGDAHLAMADYTRAIAMFPPSQTIPLLIHLTKMHIRHSEEVDRALGTVKQCLHSDPEHKQCSKMFKLLKKLHRSIEKATKLMNDGRFLDAASKNSEALGLEIPSGGKNPKGAWNLLAELGVVDANAGKVLFTDGLAKPVLKMACDCYSKLRSYDKTISWCDKAIEADPNNPDLLCNRAESHIGKEDYDAALRDFKRAEELSGGQQSQRVREGIHKVHRLQRMASRKDYYKILDVPRDASSSQIKKAYRKLAIKYHPDKYAGSKEEAEKKMSELNQAYEVLSNEELRQRFDQGEDPNDPQSHGHGHGGGHPFGGFGGFDGPIFFQQGGGGFKFHFG